MCGIAGIFHIGDKPLEERDLQKMTSSLSHRGPDGQKCWLERCVGLGHNRLAVIDLSQKAAQPMFSKDRRHVLVYNGEIYNFRKLRKELQKLGHSFCSSGDTEVLLTGLVEWGEDLVERLNGMFSFALWDRKRQSLLLARDRYGIKPLYTALRNGIFSFASEIKAIISHPNFSARLDYEGLLEYFTFQNFFSEHTLFKDIHTFPPGCILKISLDDPEPKLHRYWDFHFIDPSIKASRQEYAEELDRLFKIAVQRQMVGDVEIGAYLSSGMDSGAITAIASRHRKNFRTFTCGFDTTTASGIELDFDESSDAKTISTHFGTKHHQITLTAKHMERCLPRLVYALDEPRVGQSYPNYYAAALASRYVKVVLAGTGGDELFAGYPWRYYRAASSASFEQYIDSYYLYWQRLIPNKTIKRVFAPIWDKVRHVWTRDIFRNVFKGHPNRLCSPEDYINLSLYLEAKTFLHGLLIVEDKLSMLHGIENRVPFLDNDLVDFALQVPVRYKLGNLYHVVRLNENEPGPKVQKYYHKTRDGKLLLRQVMEKYVGGTTAWGIKQGFCGPDSSWFKNETCSIIKEMVLSSSSPIYDFLDFPTIRELVNEHLDGKVNRRLLIWSLLSFHHWCQIYLLSEKWDQHQPYVTECFQ